MHPRARWLIETLELRPHPEGGWYREIFRSEERVALHPHGVERRAMTTIYFLLAAGERSRWHRVTADEAWHLYEGDGLDLLQLTPSATRPTRHRLAPVADDDTSAPTCVVPAHAWQAARPLGDYVLVGCTVAPGFEFADFTLLADEPALGASVRERHPELADLL